jgi:hypothetical protein
MFDSSLIFLSFAIVRVIDALDIDEIDSIDEIWWVEDVKALTCFDNIALIWSVTYWLYLSIDEVLFEMNAWDDLCSVISNFRSDANIRDLNDQSLNDSTSFSFDSSDESIFSWLCVLLIDDTERDFIDDSIFLVDSFVSFIFFSFLVDLLLFKENLLSLFQMFFSFILLWLSWVIVLDMYSLLIRLDQVTVLRDSFILDVTVFRDFFAYLVVLDCSRL